MGHLRARLSGRRANQLRFTLPFPAPADGLLTSYVDDQLVLRHDASRARRQYPDTGFRRDRDGRGAHTVSFRLDALEVRKRSCRFSSKSAPSLCDLDIGDGSVTRGGGFCCCSGIDDGFPRNSADRMVWALPMPTRRQAIADRGLPYRFDVFGRASCKSTTVDGLTFVAIDAPECRTTCC